MNILTFEIKDASWFYNFIVIVRLASFKKYLSTVFIRISAQPRISAHLE